MSFDPSPATSDRPVPAVTADDGASFRIGRYEIRGEIGRGTMGIVYGAYDPSLRRTVALKTFHLSFSVSPQQYKVFEQRFFAEAWIAARLSHPGIVAVFDVGCDPELGTLYIALEYLEGRTLEELINRGVPLGWRETLEITRHVAEALHYAHSQHVVHRDIKPANIMLLPSGAPKILDFGISRMATIGLKLTTCQVVGTPLYMAPEQALGHKSDGRADLFSLGAIAYALLTGRLAFGAPSIPATVRRLVEYDPEPPSHLVPDLPGGVDEVVARALAKSPADRYSCGRDLAEDINALLDEPRARRGTVAARHGGSDDAPRPPSEPGLLDAATPPSPSAQAGIDLDAELAALVSNPALPADAVPIAERRARSRSLRFALPVALAAISVCYLALRTPTPADEGTVGASRAPPRAETPGPAGSALVARPASVGPAATTGAAPERTPPRGERQARNLDLSVEPARLRIAFERPLRRGTLRVWIDNQMVLQQDLESHETTNIPGLGLRKGRLDREIAVTPGTHTVRVQVHWDDNDRQQSLTGTFKSGTGRLLEINLGRLRKNLSLAWK